LIFRHFTTGRLGKFIAWYSFYLNSFYKYEFTIISNYNKPKLFHEAIQNFFEGINQNYKPQLSKLLTLKFLFFDDTN